MALTLLNLHEPAPLYPRRALSPRPFGLKSANLNRGIVPKRGLLYSFVVHTFGLASLLALPSLDNYLQPLPPPADHLFVIDMASKSKLVYFPELNSRDESEAPKRSKESKAPEDKRVKAKDLRTKGLSNPGQQAIVSDPPNPTNKFQTLLQPALVDPPNLQQPVPLPNIIQIAKAVPLPKPEPPKPELTVARKDLAVPAPTQAAPVPAKVALPNRAPEQLAQLPAQPATPLRKDLTVPAPTQAAPVPAKVALPNRAPEQPAQLPAQPSTPLRKDLTVPAPTLTASQRPKVVLPQANTESPMPLPEKPIELTTLQKDLAIPTPAQAATVQRQGTALTNNNSASAIPVPQRPVEKELTIAAPTQAAAPQRRSTTLANTNSASAVPVPQRPVEKELTISAPTAPDPQIAAVEMHRLDRKNLLAVSPLPAPPQPTVIVPAAEARGSVAISPESNLSGSANGPGAKTDTLPTPSAGVGKKVDGVAGNSTSNKANGSGKSDNPAAAGNGNGNSNGAPAAKSPFPGVTIQGGRLEGTGVITGVAPRPPTITFGNPPSNYAAIYAVYGITIVSNAGSGGGLPDLGVFANEQVYTVYVEMKSKSGTVLTPWTLQYAPVPATTDPTPVVPPFPIEKQSPEFPAELARKYARRQVVVYAIINAEGKLQQAAVKETPDPLLNPAALAALAKWTFKPAERNFHRVSVKILLGIPLS